MVYMAKELDLSGWCVALATLQNGEVLVSSVDRARAKSILAETSVHAGVDQARL